LEDENHAEDSKRQRVYSLASAANAIVGKEDRPSDQTEVAKVNEVPPWLVRLFNRSGVVVFSKGQAGVENQEERVIGPQKHQEQQVNALVKVVINKDTKDV
jgi:hypothetical protein